MEAASAYLPDDVVMEILARLPAKPLCRFKCVSRTWRRLITDTVRFAQTLSGFFYFGPRHDDVELPHCFAGLRGPPPPGVDTALSFLPKTCAEEMEMHLVDSCNGLLLLRNSDGFVVCNPATGDWVTLPQRRRARREMSYEMRFTVAALGFDPATSPHFHVFQLVEEESQCEYVVVAVEIFSSETGKWILNDSGCKNKYIVCNLQMTYLNGFQHFALINDDAVASVDTKGQTWRVTHVRQRDEVDYSGDGFVGHSQGCLLYVDGNPECDSISVYVLDQDHDCWKWTFKHSVSKLDLIAPTRMSPHELYLYFHIPAFHPDADLIYLYDWSSERLISYDMTRGVVHVICTLREVSHAHRQFLPYAPLYSGPLVLSSAD